MLLQMMKGEYCIRAIDENKMDYGIIFCRYKFWKIERNEEQII